MEIGHSDNKTRKDDRLESWKDIADYLDCSTRTAQRRAQKGMPVYHHESAGRVWAYKSELDAWFESLAHNAKGSAVQRSGQLAPGTHS